MNEIRCRKLIDQAINNFDLSLSRFVILTEAASGYYMLTPLIAALAGAEKVYALTKDSQYGKAESISVKTLKLAEKWGVAKKLKILFSRDDKCIEQADIVTNLGFVRPLDAPFLKRLKSTVVIPLIWETWEYRQKDLDLRECRKLGIPVLGTNENHPELDIFRYVGNLAIKLIFGLDIEVFRSEVVVIGSGEFGTHITQSLIKAGANVTQIRVAEGESLRSPIAHKGLLSCDVIVVAEHHSRKPLIGFDGQITVKELHEMNPGVSIAHIAGRVNSKEIVAAGIPCRPDNIAPGGYMSVATDYLGPRPLIDLHTAGLRIGQVLAQAITEGYSGTTAEERASRLCPLGQCFM